MFADVNPALLDMASTAGRWSTGDAVDEDLSGTLDAVRALLPDARRDLVALDEPRGSSPVQRLHVATLDLYLAAATAHQAALASDGAERTELDLLARRLRTLADRTYDRARAIVDPQVDLVDVTIVRSSPVPDWDADGLAGTVEAGADLEEEAAAQPDDEPGRRRALALLVRAEAERAVELDLGDLAAALRVVAEAMAD